MKTPEPGHGEVRLGASDTVDYRRDDLAASIEAAGVAKSKDVGFQFMTMFSAPDVGGVLSRLGALAADGRVVPGVARTYDLEETARAQQDVLTDSFRGKLVVVP